MSFVPSENPITHPTRQEWTNLRPFRFWCQKVLPLVYDDSLSYYELLCKVVDYLNKTMEDVENMNTDVNELYTNFQDFQEGTFRIYNELVTYVNNYFDNLSVQDEIDNKLDEMASDGTLLNLVEPLIPNIVTTWLNDHITPTSPAIDNTLKISEAGADAKVTGDVLRNINNLDINSLSNTNIYFIDYYRFTNDPNRLSFGRAFVYLKKGDLIYCNKETRILKCNSNDSTSFATITYVPDDGLYYIMIRNNPEAPLSVSDITYLYVKRCVNPFYMFGSYNNINTGDVTEKADTNNIRLKSGISVNNGDVISVNNGNIVATLIHDNTYTYYGRVTGKLYIKNNGILYFYFSKEFENDIQISIEKGFYNGTRNGDNLNYSNSRLSAKHKGLAYLTDAQSEVLALYDRSDSSWLVNSAYSLDLYPFNTTFTVRKSDNSVLVDSSAKTMDCYPITYDNIYAHRGMWYLAPENTLASLLCAKACGFGGVEFDIRFTSDSVPVIIHDTTINRTARTKTWETVENEIYVEDVTYQDLVNNYYFDGTYKAKQNIPTLEQYVKMCKVLGLKCIAEIAWASNTDYTREQVNWIVQTIINLSYLDNVLFTSYDLRYLKYAYDYNENCKIAYITNTMSDAYINDTISAKQNGYPTLGIAYAGNDDTLSMKCINNGISLEMNYDTHITPNFRAKRMIIDGWILGLVQ